VNPGRLFQKLPLTLPLRRLPLTLPLRRLPLTLPLRRQLILRAVELAKAPPFLTLLLDAVTVSSNIQTSVCLNVVAENVCRLAVSAVQDGCAVGEAAGAAAWRLCCGRGAAM
jgi:hypothetical protein